MADSMNGPIIKSPRNIINYYVQNIDRTPTCEDVIFACLEKLAQSTALRENPQPDEDLMKWLPAFGLVREENELIWLPPSYEFRKTDKKEVYKLRIRHRPPASKIFHGDCLFSEFLVLQALDDFLFGHLGKQCQMSKTTLMQLTALTLLFPFSFDSHPWKNFEVIDESYRLESFKLHNYRKRFSKDIYKQIITTNSRVNRLIDHYYHYKALQVLVNKYKESGRKFLDYKTAFLKIILENYPWYCFEQYEVSVKDENACISKANISLSFCNELEDQDVGIYVDIDKTQFCGLKDIERIDLTKNAAIHGQPRWELGIFTKSTPETWLFDSEDMAISFITMLQGYMTLCVQPDVILCRRLGSAGTVRKKTSVTIRDDLQSFCPMRFNEAFECLRKENDQKGPSDQCGYLIHQSKKRLHEFFVVSKNSSHLPDCTIRSLDGTRFNLTLQQENPKEFPGHKELRWHLKEKYGQQLFARKVTQCIDPDSIFFVSKSVLTAFVEPDEVSDIRTDAPAFVMQRDLKNQALYEGSEQDDYLKRYIVDIKEEKRIQAKLIVKKKDYIEAFHNSVSTIAELSRIHPKMIMNYFGPVLAPTTPLSFLYEYSDFGDILSFLKRNRIGITNLMRMEFALEVAKIVLTLTQPGQDSSPILHGNLRGHNFWVFNCKTKRRRYYLKLGDPGLVPFYNNLQLSNGDNIKRIPWLSPERQKNLAEVTVASECYAAATTIAEIFHGSDDFTTIIDQSGGTQMEIPLPKFPDSGEEAVMDSVKTVTMELWNTLRRCWVPNPQNRHSPRELHYEIIGHLEESRAIPHEKVDYDLKAYIASFSDERTEHLTRKQCHALLQRYNSTYVLPDCVTITTTRLGKGNFGSVFKGKMSQMDVAIKKPNASPDGKKNYELEKSLEEECRLYAKLDHANIVKYFNYTRDNSNNLWIIMEFMNSKALKQFACDNGYKLSKRGPDRVEYIKGLLDISMDITKGMAYLEGAGVLHCDLAARNVLLNEVNGVYTAKVADFGMAKVFEEHQYYIYVQTLLAQPLDWYPPEYLHFERNGVASAGVSFTSAGDVWAYGTTLWEIFTKGKSPSAIRRQRGNNKDSVNAWLSNFFLVERERWPREDIDQDIYDVMMKCWKIDPSDRPNFSQLQKEIHKLLLTKRD